QLRFGKISDATGQTPNIPVIINTGPVGPVLPSRITFNDLIGQNPQYNVFRTSCMGCHSGATPAGSLDITSYAAAQAVSATILSRTGNNNAPMPPGGLLGPTPREAVSIWVNGGAPEN